MHKLFVPKWIADLGQPEIDRLLEAGSLRVYGDTLAPVIGGAEADESEPVFAPVPEDLSTLDDDALAALIGSYETSIADVTADPAQFVSAEYTTAELLAETQAAVDALRAMKADLAARTADVPVAELTDEDRAAFEALAAADTDPAPEAEPEPEAAPAEPEPEAAVVASARLSVRARRPLPQPTPSREIAERAPVDRQVALTAAAGAPDMIPGDTFDSDLGVAQAMIRRHKAFGSAGPGTVEKFSIARADWAAEYPDDRRLGQSIEANFATIDSVIRPAAIKAELAARRRAQINGAPDDLVASGGLCAPVTPYYNLQYLSVPERPVMGALPSFNADRGGLRYARPAALSAVTTAVGVITEEEDREASSATKSCQVIPCPPFQETDVDTIYHCLQFGNLGARAFPELVAQWNNLVLAAHARLAESNLLTQIDAFSTQVTAGSLGLGASATLFSQILTAANGLRSRNRMDPEAVLRIMLPYWAVDLIVSDVIRTQFQRFDTDRAKVVALLRSFNIEPTFYIDGANGRAQVYGAQSDGALLPFPADVVWYLYPEGSFLYLDGGTLELGIVRDSVLNITNDFQIFGETFENVAFVGVESLAVVTTTCDSGVVVAPATSDGCPISYAS